MSDFEQKVKSFAEKAILELISSGRWIEPDYRNRIKVPPEIMTAAWDMVNTDGIKEQLAKRIEKELADRIVNQMAAEIATDVKQILSVKERREEIRHVARTHLMHLAARNEGDKS